MKEKEAEKGPSGYFFYIIAWPPDHDPKLACNIKISA